VSDHPVDQKVPHEVIHGYVFDPRHSLFKSSQNDKAKCTTIYCCNKLSCPLYAQKRCVYMHVFPDRCPYGYKRVEEGFTRRARKLSSWVSERKEKYRGKSLSAAPPVLCRIGAYVYLPYAHMSMNKDVPFLRHSHVFDSGIPFVLAKDFTIEAVAKLLTFRPQALMAGANGSHEICSYQTEQVPSFLIHLKEQMPDLFSRVADKYPELITSKMSDYSPVGRKALVATLRKGCVFVKDKGKDRITEEWVWDGKDFVCENAEYLLGSFSGLKAENVCIKITPEPGAEIEITDVRQVTPQTVFKS